MKKHEAEILLRAYQDYEEVARQWAIVSKCIEHHHPAKELRYTSDGHTAEIEIPHQIVLSMIGEEMKVAADRIRQYGGEAPPLPVEIG